MRRPQLKHQDDSLAACCFKDREHTMTSNGPSGALALEHWRGGWQAKGERHLRHRYLDTVYLSVCRQASEFRHHD